MGETQQQLIYSPFNKVTSNVTITKCALENSPFAYWDVTCAGKITASFDGTLYQATGGGVINISTKPVLAGNGLASYFAQIVTGSNFNPDTNTLGTVLQGDDLGTASGSIRLQYVILGSSKYSDLAYFAIENAYFSNMSSTLNIYEGN